MRSSSTSHARTEPARAPRAVLHPLIAWLVLSACGAERTGDPGTGAEPGAIPPGAPTVSLDASVRYQTINGWEAVAQIGQVECPPDALERYRDEVLQRAPQRPGLGAGKYPEAPGSRKRASLFSSAPAWLAFLA